jgi:hypothetical protein
VNEGLDATELNQNVRADVAQLVERLLAMQKVEASSPFIHSIESPAKAGSSVAKLDCVERNVLAEYS